MKVILDIKDDVLADMQLLAEIEQIPLNEIIEETFIRYVKEPKQAVYKAYNEDQRSVELMQKLLHHYLTECIEGLSKTGSEMAEVFKVIRDDIVDQDAVIAKLYKTFKATH